LSSGDYLSHATNAGQLVGGVPPFVTCTPDAVPSMVNAELSALSLAGATMPLPKWS
jgi:hypothetical protein